MAAERIAHGEIYVEVNDDQARAALKALDRDFERTMKDIDHEKATVTVDARIAPFEDQVAKAKRQLKALEGQKASTKVDADAKVFNAKIKKVKAEIKRLEGRKAVVEMEVKGDEKVAKAIERNRKLEEKRAQAWEKAEARRERIIEQSRAREARIEAERIRGIRRVSDFSARMNKQREREMSSAHSWALKVNRDMDMQAQQRERELRDIPRIQRRYADLEHQVARLNRERNRMRNRVLSPELVQSVSIKQADVVAEMESLRLKLAAMGAKPIDQKIDLDIDQRGVGMLGKWLAALTETTVRVGPFTTTIAGLTRALALLGPVITGVIGHVGALTAAIGAGLVGAAGMAVGALGAFGVSLGGVAFLLPSLLRDFKNLNTLQNAYHVQVLKTGAESDKAKKKLKEFKHALGEVSPTTQKAFLSIDKLQDRFRKMSKEARPDFFDALGSSISVINKRFDWFSKNTLAAFHNVSEGWQEWMKGLESDEAGRILKTLGRNGNASLRPLMGALGNLATFVGRISESFSKLLPNAMKGFEAWTQGLANGVSDTEELDKKTRDLGESMKSTGKFVGALANFLIALFAPGVDVGRASLDKYTEGLNNAADAMRTTKREGIADFFREATRTSEKFVTAIAPFAKLFFEWTTIMRPFTNVALDMLHVLGSILHTLLDFGPTKALLLGAFGVFLYGALVKRVVSIGSGLWNIAKAMMAIKAAGGLGAALKGGALKFITGGLAGRSQPGGSPANPMYTVQVGGGGVPGRGAPGRSPGGGPGLGTLISQAPKFVRVAGGVGLIAGAFVALTKAVGALEQKKATKKVSKDLQEMIATRNVEGIRDLTNEMKDYGDGLDSLRKPARDALREVQRLENGIATSSITTNFRNIQRNGSATFRAIANTVRTNMGTIRSRMDTNSAEGKAAIAKNFRLAADAVKKRMHDTGQTTKAGTALVRKYMIESLKSMGLTGPQAEAKVKHGTLQNSEDRPGAATMARGGMLQLGRKGERGRDTIPMSVGGTNIIAAPGEQVAVFNAHQQAKFGGVYPGGLEGFFAGPQRPHHMAGGGIVPVPGFPGERANQSILDNIAWVTRRFPSLILTDAFGSGHDSPGHTVTGTAADFDGPDPVMDRAVAALVKMGYLVGYDGRFGSQDWPGHGPSTRTANHHFHVEFGTRGAGGGSIADLMPQIPEVSTNIPGAPGAVANQALSIVRDTAQTTAERIAETILSTPVAGGHSAGAAMGDEALMEVIRRALKWTDHYTPGNASLLRGRVMQESGGNPSIVQQVHDINSGGNEGVGLGQIIPGTFAAYRDKRLPNDRTNPMANLVAVINYMFAKYGHIVGPSSTGYATGGLVPDAKTFARGGKVNTPRLLVGEETHGETVISHNKAYRGRNIGLLRQAAQSLGVPMAQQGGHLGLGGLHGGVSEVIGKKAGHRAATSFRKNKKIIDKGGDTDKLTPVVQYGKLQGKESDTQRNISIAESKFEEPASFLKFAGKDVAGNDLYEVDESVVSRYQAGLNQIIGLYDSLFTILAQMRAAAQQSFSLIAAYIARRNSNIAQIDVDIDRNRRLLKSKNKKTREHAQDRLDTLHTQRSVEVEKRGNAKDTRKGIKEDQHDARFREREYTIARGSVVHDRDVVATNASEELESANPEAPGTDAGGAGGLSYNAQLAALDSERYNIFREFNSNMQALGSTASPIGAAGLGGGQGMQSNPAAVGNAVATAISGSSGAGGAINTPRTGGGGGAREGAGGGIVPPSGPAQTTKVVNVTNNYKSQPADPHPWAQGVAYELNAAL